VGAAVDVAQAGLRHRSHARRVGAPVCPARRRHTEQSRARVQVGDYFGGGMLERLDDPIGLPNCSRTFE